MLVLSIIILHSSLLNLLSAVPLCCFLCVHEIEGAGDSEPDVDIRMCGSESEVESPRQCRLHILKALFRFQV